MNYLLGIDFGGGASKAALIDTSGTVLAESMAEYPSLYPSANACEQNPQHWIEALIKNIKAVLAKSKVNPKDILAVAIDSATHTAVLCSKDNTPLRPAIHWTDSRSEPQAKRLKERCKDSIFKITYHYPDTIWTLAQLMWVRENEPNLFSRISRIYFEKDYIRFFLTEMWCTDYIEAQGSMLYDCVKNEWCAELCELAGIPQTALPPVIAPQSPAGCITKKAAAQTGLCEGTKIICGATDTCLEVLAAGAVSRGDITVKLATAGRICVITDKPYPNQHLVNYSHAVPGLWYPGTATKAAASSYRWYKETFGGEYKELDEAAANVPIGCNGLLYHPYINGELTPYADPALCGSFIGLRAMNTKAYFTRAVLEGVSLSLLHSKKTLEKIGIPFTGKAVIIGGGSKSRLWRQITADCLGTKLIKTKNSDSSLGAAMLAGVAYGVFSSCEEAVKLCVKEDCVTSPISENTRKYEKIFEEYKAVHDALEHIYKSRRP